MKTTMPPTEKIAELEQRVEELEGALREIVPVLDELVGWINTDVSGCVPVEERGEAALRRVRALMAK